MPKTAAAARRTQAERSADMKLRLVEAAIESLIENGYAHTTTVEVCRRAGVTRGALNHHFESPAALLTATLEELYDRLRAARAEPGEPSLEALVRASWERVGRPEFKAVIEIWLAARNDPDLGKDLGPAIAGLSRLFSPEGSPALGEIVGADPERTAFYRLASEAMIGLALGRASSPGGRPVEHEAEVIGLLARLARERDAR